MSLENMTGFILAAVGLLLAAPAHAYTCIDGDPPDCTIQCGNEPVTYQLGDLPTDLGEAEVETAIQDAAALWNDTNCGVTLEYVGRTPAGGQDADIELTWLETWNPNFGNPLTTFSVAVVSYGTDGCISPGQILLNDGNFSWNVDGTMTDENQDVFSNASVQFGRTLGLGNSDDPDNSIITPESGSVAVTELGSDDIAGLCAIYAQSGGDDMGTGDDAGVADDVGGGMDAGGDAPDMGTTSDDVGTTAEDMGSESEEDGGGTQVNVIDDTDEPSSGCCATTGANGSGGSALLMLFGLFIVRRRLRR